ncbi:MAG TPA: cobalamin ABC transporter substrate-binding protein [Polyangiaceae bacterium]
MRRGFAIAGVLAVLAAPLGCGKGANGPGRDLPPYTGHSADLFDDGIDPDAVGFQVDPGPPPMSDTRLRERTQTGDAVVRARVLTVTEKREEKRHTWQLGMHTVERLAGSGPLDDDFTLEVEDTDPGAPMVHAFQGGLVSKTFVAFVRAFASPVAADEWDEHFHLAADTPGVKQAVQSAVLLQQVR